MYIIQGIHKKEEILAQLVLRWCGAFFVPVFVPAIVIPSPAVFFFLKPRIVVGCWLVVAGIAKTKRNHPLVIPIINVSVTSASDWTGWECSCASWLIMSRSTLLPPVCYSYSFEWTLRNDGCSSVLLWQCWKLVNSLLSYKIKLLSSHDCWILLICIGPARIIGWFNVAGHCIGVMAGKPEVVSYKINL